MDGKMRMEVMDFEPNTPKWPKWHQREGKWWIQAIVHFWDENKVKPTSDLLWKWSLYFITSLLLSLSFNYAWLC